MFEPTQHIEDLFFNAKEAYEDKEVESLKSTLYLIDAYKKKHPEDLSSKDLQELEKYKNILKIRIGLVEKELDDIVNSKPQFQTLHFTGFPEQSKESQFL